MYNLVKKSLVEDGERHLVCPKKGLRRKAEKQKGLGACGGEEDNNECNAHSLHV